MKVIAIILAGGIGKRFGSKIPKQFMSLNGQPVVQYVVDTIKESKVIDGIVIVGKSKYWDSVSVSAVEVDGGSTRVESVLNGLRAAEEIKGTHVIFFDAVRPFITTQYVRKIAKELKNGEKAIVTVQKITDSLSRVNEKYVDKPVNRNEYRLVQTPEAFELKTLQKAYEHPNKLGTAIADSIKGKVKYLEIDDNNLKITYKKDIFNAEQLIKYREVIRRTPNVKDKRILVFGGSGGIGSEVVRQLKELGAIVTSPTHKEADVANMFRKWDKVWSEKYECIVNCSGAYSRDSDLDDEKIDTILRVNIKANLAILDMAMFKSEVKNVVIVGSTAASFGRRGIGLYSATQSAKNALVEAYVKELEKKGTKVNVVCPANVNTKLQTVLNPTKDASKMMQPEEIAKVIVGYCDVEFTGHIVYVKEGER